MMRKRKMIKKLKPKAKRGMAIEKGEKVAAVYQKLVKKYKNK